MSLTVEQNDDPSYSKELYVGIQKDNGIWWQDLAIIRPAMVGEESGVWSKDTFEIKVFADKDNEDYTHEFTVGLYCENE